MNFGEKVIDYHLSLKPNWKLPKGFELIYPFDSEETTSLFKTFYNKYFSDKSTRRFLFGINPGRFGAGVTGVPFTDPYFLELECGIENDFKKRKELSAIFIYDLINQMGGVKSFYERFYISSVCPLGFLKKGINANYYDDKKLEQAVLNKIVKNIKTQIEFGCDLKFAYSLGKGKNYKFLKALNDKHKFFEKVIPLPHPRWVMQYKLKEKQKHLDSIAMLLNM